MPRTKKPKWPQHKMGKYYGYEEYEDGSIKPAPGLYDQMDEALALDRVTNHMIRQIVEQCHELYKPTAQMRERFWKKLQEEYDLDMENFTWSYNPSTHVVMRSPKEKEIS